MVFILMCVSKILPRRPFVLHFLWKGVYLPAILTTEKCAFRISDSVPFLRAYHKQHCTAMWALSLGFWLRLLLLNLTTGAMEHEIELHPRPKTAQMLHEGGAENYFPMVPLDVFHRSGR